MAVPLESKMEHDAPPSSSTSALDNENYNEEVSNLTTALSSSSVASGTSDAVLTTRKSTSFKIINILPSRPPSNDAESGEDDIDDSRAEETSDYSSVSEQVSMPPALVNTNGALVSKRKMSDSDIFVPGTHATGIDKCIATPPVLQYQPVTEFVHGPKDRFKVVKLETEQPIKRGRWTCIDAVDKNCTKFTWLAAITGVVAAPNEKTDKVAKPVDLPDVEGKFDVIHCIVSTTVNTTDSQLVSAATSGIPHVFATYSSTPVTQTLLSYATAIQNGLDIPPVSYDQAAFRNNCVTRSIYAGTSAPHPSVCSHTAYPHPILPPNQPPVPQILQHGMTNIYSAPPLVPMGVGGTTPPLVNVCNTGMIPPILRTASSFTATTNHPSAPHQAYTNPTWSSQGQFLPPVDSLSSVITGGAAPLMSINSKPSYVQSNFVPKNESTQRAVFSDIHASVSYTISQPGNTVFTQASTVDNQHLVDGLVQISALPTSQSTDESASGSNQGAIDNRIEQAMDLVKSHLMSAVRHEVEDLKNKILRQEEAISTLQYENDFLKANVSNEVLLQLPQIRASNHLQQQQTTSSNPAGLSRSHLRMQ